MFPANAGMILWDFILSATIPGVPHECGDDPWYVIEFLIDEWCSPANAGMILYDFDGSTGFDSVPRECGDDPRNR